MHIFPLPRRIRCSLVLFYYKKLEKGTANIGLNILEFLVKTSQLFRVSGV
jgi:hypothetical protein